MNKQILCCICLEYENSLACMKCDICKEGIVCCHCMDEIENVNNNIIQYCPICRNLLISYSIKNIISSALIDGYGIQQNNNLIKNWFNNYYETDFYKEIEN